MRSRARARAGAGAEKKEEKEEENQESGITIGSISAFLSVPLSIFIDVSPKKNIIMTVRSVFIQEDAFDSV